MLKRSFKDWSELMDTLGYAWEPHTVLTEDGWTLTVFRILGRNDGTTKRLQDKKQFPILALHGANDSGFGWVSKYMRDGNLIIKLVDQGYDVWVHNSRGTRYSNKNKRDGEWSLEERWNFSWAEMGVIDVPAVTEKMLEVTGKEKITLMGYSQGTS